MNNRSVALYSMRVVTTVYSLYISYVHVRLALLASGLLVNAYVVLRTAGRLLLHRLRTVGGPLRALVGYASTG